MNAHSTATSDITSRDETAHSTWVGTPVAGRPVGECRTKAIEFLTELIGARPDDLVWDDVHRLLGHWRVEGVSLVVIATRDDDNPTVVVAADDWDAIRIATPNDRRELLAASAITDRYTFIARVSADVDTAGQLAHAA